MSRRTILKPLLCILVIGCTGIGLSGKDQPEVSESLKKVMNSKGNLYVLKNDLEQLAMKGDCVAQFLYGLLLQYYEEPGPVLIPWFRKAASCGVIAAELPLACLIGNTGDQTESMKLYLIAAYHGDPVALCMVANNYKQDFLFNKRLNGARALAWYRLAELRGDQQSIEVSRANITWIMHALSDEERRESDNIFRELTKTIPNAPGYPKGFDQKWLTMFEKGED